MHRFLYLPLLLVATACSTGGTSTAMAPESIAFAPSLGVDVAAMERLRDGVLVRDLVVGSGPSVRRGSRVGVHFAGFLPDGTQFDAAAPPNPPVEFVLGAGGVIRGWQTGIVGMRVGGQRQLVVPASEAYGTQSVGRVPPNATLVFVIKLVSAR